MVKKVNQHKKTDARDPDLANAEVALRRAAKRAREIAKETGTSVIYSINGKIVKETPSVEMVNKKDTPQR